MTASLPTPRSDDLCLSSATTLNDDENNRIPSKEQVEELPPETSQRVANQDGSRGALECEVTQGPSSASRRQGQWYEMDAGYDEVPGRTDRPVICPEVARSATAGRSHRHMAEDGGRRCPTLAQSSSVAVYQRRSVADGGCRRPSPTPCGKCRWRLVAVSAYWLQTATDGVTHRYFLVDRYFLSIALHLLASYLYISLHCPQ